MITSAYIVIVILAGSLAYIVVAGIAAGLKEGIEHGTDEPGPDQPQPTPQRCERLPDDWVTQYVAAVDGD